MLSLLEDKKSEGNMFPLCGDEKIHKEVCFFGKITENGLIDFLIK
tara:strand:- start:43 stop:177 length:135 start_codon:yes stop_codon:yes gene_type:complete